MLGDALRRAIVQLADAGVPSPAVDARLIASHLTGIPPLELIVHGDASEPPEFAALIARRATREPLQWILGTAPFGPLELRVGPGVFIPRPETEVLAHWAVEQAREASARPVVVDLCTGSGALAAFVAHALPAAHVVAVERAESACQYARRNLPARVRLVQADAAAAETLAELDGQVDVVVSNPPYVPQAVEVAPEVHFDPPEAVFAGDDGLDLIPALIARAGMLLRAGGVCGIEHHDDASAAVRGLLAEHGQFRDVRALHDLTGCPRFALASRV